MLKINRDFPVNHRLHLPQPPIGLCRVAHKITRHQEIIHHFPLFIQANPVLTEQTDIGAQITSRICHDLISPIGAISNGLELLALSGVPLGPELALITESAEAANAKLRFLRIAFGSAQSGSNVSAPEVTEILHRYYNDPRTQLNWAIETALDKPDLRLLFLVLLCLEKMAPYGGHIIVTDTGVDYVITLLAGTLKIDGFLDLTGHRFMPQDGPPLIQFNLAQTMLHQIGYQLVLSKKPDRLNITITR